MLKRSCDREVSGLYRCAVDNQAPWCQCVIHVSSLEAKTRDFATLLAVTRSSRAVVEQCSAVYTTDRSLTCKSLLCWPRRSSEKDDAARHEFLNSRLIHLSSSCLWRGCRPA